MYLDVKGLVTVAIGNLIDPVGAALDLPFVHADGSPASRAEIDYAWHTVKAHGELAHQGNYNAQFLTDLRLTPEGISELVGTVLKRFASALAAHYPGFESWPADAQLATLAMAWACGPAFHAVGFGALEHALRAGDFVAAANCCHINEVGNAGVHPRNLAMRDLYFLAAAKPEDADALHWPAVDHVKAFQAEHDLEADGIVGPKTLAAIAAPTAG